MKKIKVTVYKENSCGCYYVKLKTWQEITDIPKEKQGTAKALSLTEETEWSICKTVFDKLSITELKAGKWFKTIVPFFDNKS